VKERLDRALATEGWCSRFPEVVVNVLPTRSSDHKPLWIQFLPNSYYTRTPKLFRSEVGWSLDEECLEIVKLAWRMRGGGSSSAPVGGLSVGLIYVELCEIGGCGQIDKIHFLPAGEIAVPGASR
jgi:hypothetical protein